MGSGSGSSSLRWSEVRDFLRLAAICLLWYFVSSANGVMGKWILQDFPHPMTLTLVQLASISVYSRPVLRGLGIRPMAHVRWGYYAKYVLSLAMAKFLSSVLAHISIWKVPVSYAHTVKATMPLFTVLLTRLFVPGQRYSVRTYLSLLPIVAGVAVATLTEVQFDVMGLACALMATGGFSAMTIMTKKIIEDTGVHSLRLLLVLGQLSFLMFLPVWALIDLGPVLRHPLLAAEGSADMAHINLLILLLVDGLCHWLQNILAFTLMKLVTPLTYSVANVTKRIAVISVSLLMLKNHVTALNALGMTTAVAGVFFYNKIKLDEKRAMETLPTSAREDNNNVNGKKLQLWNNHYTLPKVQLEAAAPATYANHSAAPGSYANHSAAPGRYGNYSAGQGTYANHSATSGLYTNHSAAPPYPGDPGGYRRYQNL